MRQAEAAEDRVLMFAYYFPPQGGGGVQRTLKYVKYLPTAGFSSIVITGSARGFPVRDHTLLREIPGGTVVVRARALPVQKARWRFEGLLRRAGLAPGIAEWLGWPDPLIGWLPAAVWHGLRVARARRPVVLYSTSSPVAAHLAALIVHRLTGIPWVADFRDGWTLNPHADGVHWPLARGNHALEKKVTCGAAAAVVVDESIRLIGLPSGSSKLVTIQNGIDPDDVELDRLTAPDPDKFTLSYVGSLYGRRDAAPVFSAVKLLIDRGTLDPTRFELRVAGATNIDRSIIESLPVFETGYVEHHRAVEEMGRASVLLLYSPRGDLGSSGKVYEYLAVGRPVLCVAERDSRARRLVDELGAGQCVEPDVSDVADALQRFLGHWQRGTLAVDPSVREETLRRYSRQAQAFKLAAVLRAAIAQSAG